MADIPGFPTLPDLQSGDCEQDVLSLLTLHQQAMQALCDYTQDLRDELDEIKLNGGGGGEATFPQECTDNLAQAATSLRDLSGGNFDTCRATVTYTVSVSGENGDDNAGVFANPNGSVSVYCDGVLQGTQSYSMSSGLLGNNEQWGSLTRTLTFEFDCQGVITLEVDSESIGGGVNGPSTTTRNICSSAICV